jgi:small subunit ribosomal protein S1
MLWAKLEIDQTYSGTVKTLKEYGAFIDIGGVDGFLHIGEISWTRVNHPSDVLAEGQAVDVKIIALDREKKKISLGMRQLAANPWSTAEANYRPGSTVSGKVTRTADFGAFVELEPGVEGLIHISELDHRHVRKVTEVLTVGQSVDVQVLEVDPARKRISLSLKALQPKPQPEEKAVAEQPASPERPQRKKPMKLKGGIGGPTKGGLFGNPKDFD